MADTSSKLITATVSFWEPFDRTPHALESNYVNYVTTTSDGGFCLHRNLGIK